MKKVQNIFRKIEMIKVQKLWLTIGQCFNHPTNWQANNFTPNPNFRFPELYVEDENLGNFVKLLQSTQQSRNVELVMPRH